MLYSNKIGIANICVVLSANKPKIKIYGPPVQGSSNRQTTKPIKKAPNGVVTLPNIFFRVGLHFLGISVTKPPAPYQK